MLRVAAVAVVLLVACETQPHLPLGAWSSDRALTLASLSQAPTLTRSYQAALADPTLFGRNIQVFTPSGAVVWFEGECGEFTPFEVIESRPGFVRFRRHDPLLDSPEERSVTWSSDFMYLPLGNGAAHEVFRRVALSEALASHPCLQAELERSR